MVPKPPARDRNLVGREPNHSKSPLSKSSRTRQCDSAAGKWARRDSFPYRERNSRTAFL